MTLFSSVRGLSLLTVLMALPMSGARAEDLVLSDSSRFPGRLWVSEGGTAERLVHVREPRPNPAFPRAVMKLAQSAVSSDGKVYYCSGLDGSMMHLLDGRNEIQVFDFDGQIRDVACTGEEHTVYFSTVETPQNGAPLADGKIWRRDFYEGRATEVATIRQADVGGNWWGTFTIKDGKIYLATLDTGSRIFQLTSDGPVRVFAENRNRISGFASGAGDDFYFANGSGRVFRTTDFATVEPVLETSLRLSDVAIRQGADAPRP